MIAFERAVLSSKSFVIPLALISKVITVEFAVSAARLEVNHQILRWGEVQDGRLLSIVQKNIDFQYVYIAHDIDYHNLKKDLSASYLTCLT